MYAFLSRVRTSSIVKATIIIILFLSLNSFLSVLVIVLIIKSRDTDPERFKCEIDEFKYKYDTIRESVLDTNEMIYIGSYVSEYEKKTCYFSRFISIYIKNCCDSIVSKCQYMERRQIENDIYYQYPIKKKYSKIAKITIILSIVKYIKEKHPNDLVTFDKKSPIAISVVDVL